MIMKLFETERLIEKSFSELTDEEKQGIVRSFKNPFNARFNAIDNPYTTVEEISTRKEPTFSGIGKTLDTFKDTNYFRAFFDKFSGELVGVSRFGVYYKKQKIDIWDFAMFNVLMKHWGRGYGVEMLKGICDFAITKGVKYIYAGADHDNFGSYHAMIKSGFKYSGTEDGDFEYRRDLSIPFPTEKQINEEWEKHIRRYIRKYGKKRFNRLMKINNLTKEMVNRIKNGENEDELIMKYYKICNELQEFPEKSTGK